MKINGLTLLELLITLSIISILGGLSYPVYKEHIERAYYNEAKIALEQLGNALEKCHLLNGSYENVSLSELKIHPFTSHNQYRLSIASNTENEYQIKASAQKNVHRSYQTILLNNKGEIIEAN